MHASQAELGLGRYLNIVNSFLNLRVADIQACYKEWKAKGTHFLTEPLDNHGREIAMLRRRPASCGQERQP